MSLSSSLPTVAKFAEVLAPESRWYTLGIFLGVSTHELDAITRNCRGEDHVRCLIEVYKCMESRGKIPSWEDIAQSLKNMGNYSMADKIRSEFILPHLSLTSDQDSRPENDQNVPPGNEPVRRSRSDGDLSVVGRSSKAEEVVIKAIAKEFDTLAKRFALLITKIKAALKASRVDVEEMQDLIMELCGLEPLQQEQATIDAVMKRLHPHYSILNFDILTVLVNHLLQQNDVLQREVADYKKRVDDFKSSAQIGHLVDFMKTKRSSSGKHKIMKLKVREFWSKFTMKKFEDVMNEIVETLYERVSHISVDKGCVCVSWVVPDIHTSKLFTPSSGLMKTIGVISLHIGNQEIFRAPEGCEVIEAAMLQAVELKNTRAMELLLAMGCDPEVATCNGGNAVTTIVNVRDSGDSGSMKCVCVFGHNKHVEAILSGNNQSDVSELRRKAFVNLLQENEKLKKTLANIASGRTEPTISRLDKEIEFEEHSAKLMKKAHQLLEAHQDKAGTVVAEHSVKIQREEEEIGKKESQIPQLIHKFDDQLTCSVCLDQYTNPKTLACLHSFCLKCIEPLPIEIKGGKYYISCPTCRVNHLVPEGGAKNLPNAFLIDSLLELRREQNTRKRAQGTCPNHNDPLEVYCETCCKVICRYCIFSSTHNKHHFELISKCYPKHHQQIQDDLDLLKHKTADVNTVVTALVTREREVAQQGEDVKNEIHTHAQQLIDQVQRSERQLLQQVDTVVQQKRHLLIKQRKQAERVHTQLKTCQEMVQQSLKEWNQQQVMMEKQRMLSKIKTVSKHVEPTVFQPMEKADLKIMRKNVVEKDIGEIKSHRYGKAFLKLSPYRCLPKRTSTAVLTLQSHDGLSFLLPPSCISGILSSPQAGDVKCDINQTQQGEYNVSFTPCTTGEHQLIVQVGGIDISGSPFTLFAIPSPGMQSKPVQTVTGLNRPYGIAVCDNGDLVVAEWGAHRVSILNKNGKKIRSFGAGGKKFQHPHGVAISNDGHILVTDNHHLWKLTYEGEVVKSVGSMNEGSGKLMFRWPMGIAVHPTTGQIFVADSLNDRIQVLNNDLTFSHTITLRGDKQFSWPWDVALDSEECLYIAERFNNCITKLTTTGEYIARFGSEGSAPGQLCRPSFLTISHNLVYVTEEGNHRVSIFDTNGHFLRCFGKRVSGKGELNGPRGITMDKLGNLYVSDFDSRKILMF